MKRIAIIANGHIEKNKALVQQIVNHDEIIAVDGGLNHCLDLNLSPNVLIGDMDSVIPSALAHFPDVKKITYPIDKNETDLELAIGYALKKNPYSITLFAVLGDRTDHTLCNLNLIARHPGRIFIETAFERLFVLKNEETPISVSMSQTISLIPLGGPVVGLTTTGLKWELNNAKLDPYAVIGVSNKALSSQITISVKQGSLLCIMIK